MKDDFIKIFNKDVYDICSKLNIDKFKNRYNFRIDERNENKKYVPITYKFGG